MKTPERIKSRDTQNKKPIKSTINIAKPEGKRGILRGNPSGLFILISPTKYLSEILTGCNFSAGKKETADEAAESEKIKTIQKEYIADIQKFRKDIGEKISSNEKSIANFNLRLSKEKKQIDLLEQKNKSLKKQLNEYQPYIKDSWTAFKSGFSYEMNLLDQQLNHLIISTKK